MGRRQIVEGLEKSERKKRRAQLGSLKSLVLRPTTITRYEKAFRAFVQYLNLHHIELSNTRSGLDRQVVDYLNFLWEDGESLALAGDTIKYSAFSAKLQTEPQPILENAENMAAA